jgi:sigma-B regulation protein RsbU (phosphoserine phosphatase)
MILAVLLIAFISGVRRQVTTLDTLLRTVLCLYTDGLIERPHEPIDDGLARLRRAVAAEPADTVCVTVMAALVDDAPARDDTALLAFRRQPSDSCHRG